MPRQNWVTPFGMIVRRPPGAARGTLFGNRGCLHDDDPEGTPRRAWRSRAWILCRLAFRGRRRPVAPPGRYTGLFFLDEATGFAAGHRPCAECRWADYRRFRTAWPALAGRPVAALDAVLHGERRRPLADRPPWNGPPPPDGTLLADDAGTAWLALSGALRRWSHAGYGPAAGWSAVGPLRLLTPPALVAALAAGYRPEIHASAADDPPGTQKVE